MELDLAGMSAKASFKIEQLLKVEELFKSGEFGSRIRQFFFKWGNFQQEQSITKIKT